MDPAARRRVLEAGNSAPSGENCQPWRFAPREDGIDVFLRRNDHSVYNWGDRAAYLAIGAATENMVLAAAQEGFAAAVSYFPSADEEHAVGITFTPAHKDADLSGHIQDRVTNRKPYKKLSLTESERSSLLHCSNETATVRLLEDATSMQRLGRDGSTNEEVMLTNKGIHDFFFSHVTWTKQEDDEKRAGFYIETLELPPPGKAIFRLLRKWGRARVFNTLGMYKLVASGNGATNASASAIGGISIRSTDPETFVRTGRVLERLWLQATALGLSFQPIAGMLFMKLCIDMGETSDFTPANLAAIERAYGDAAQRLSTPNERLIFMFRVGHSDPPTARSSRFPLETALS